MVFRGLFTRRTPRGGRSGMPAAPPVEQDDAEDRVEGHERPSNRSTELLFSRTGAEPPAVVPDVATPDDERSRVHSTRAEAESQSPRSSFETAFTQQHAPEAPHTVTDPQPSVAAEDGIGDRVRPESRVRTSLPTTGTSLPAWPERMSADDDIRPVTIGEPSTFGSKDWWSSGWWPMSSSDGDLVADFATHGALAVAGVSLRGHKHRFAGEPCEDAFHFRSADGPTGPVVCVAVCDGVGSAAESRTAARWLSERVTFSLAAASEGSQSPLMPDDVRNAGMRAIEDVRERAGQQGYALSDLRTTLTFAIIPASPTATGPMFIGQVGDSPAFLGEEAGWLPIPDTDSAPGMILTNVTQDALSAEPSELDVATMLLPPGGRLILCSDGIGNFVRSRGSVLDLGRHLAQALRAPVPPLDLVRHASFDLRSADDDRTLVVVWRMASESPPA
jgi:serine/threonine protein phosphatase PrpC